MTGEARRRATRRWRQMRSAHAEVLDGIERAVAMHPAGGRSVTRRVASKNVARVPRDDAEPTDTE